jgi:hypothetical protein
MPYIEALAAGRAERQPAAVGDVDDPRPWLEAHAAGVGSPLELRFLRLFEAHGFHPAKQVPVAPRDGETPISIADFAVPERRLAIYIGLNMDSRELRSHPVSGLIYGEPILSSVL